MADKIISTELPEWAWLSAGDHEENGDILAQRNVIYHVRSATVIEIFPEDKFVANPGVMTYKFKHYSALAGEERFIAVLHYSALDLDKDQKRDILVHAALWFCKYCIWEDENISTDDYIDNLAKLN